MRRGGEEKGCTHQVLMFPDRDQGRNAGPAKKPIKSEFFNPYVPVNTDCHRYSCNTTRDSGQ